MIVGKLIFETPGARLAAEFVVPFVDVLKQILDAGVAVRQYLPVELQIEGPEAFHGADVLCASRTNDRFEAAVLHRPGVGWERFSCHFDPPIRSLAVEEYLPVVSRKQRGNA